jgi:hypothetical protein
MEARVREVDVPLVVEVEVVGEVEPHALGFRGEQRGQPALGADLEQAEVGVGDVEVPGAPVEADPERAAADVLVGEVVQRRRLGPTADLLGPARGRGGEGRPPRAVPEHDPPVGDARVGPAAPPVERHALGPLHVAAEPHLRAAEPLRGVGVPRHLVGAGEIHGVRLEVREVDHAAPPQRVRAAERRQRRHHKRRGHHPWRRHPLLRRCRAQASKRFNWREWEWGFRSARLEGSSSLGRAEAAAASFCTESFAEVVGIARG